MQRSSLINDFRILSELLLRMREDAIDTGDKARILGSDLPITGIGKSPGTITQTELHGITDI